MDIEFFKDYAGRPVRLARERRRHILEHPEMQEWVEKIPEVLKRLEQVVRSRSVSEMELYYAWKARTSVGAKYLCVVVIARAGDWFVVTAYLTDAIKKREMLWPRSAR